MASKGVARLGDTGSHGGAITTGASSIIVNDRPMARVGDIYACPVHGNNPIISGAASIFGQNMLVAHVGSATACGAVITSGSPDTFVDDTTSAKISSKERNALLDSLLRPDCAYLKTKQFSLEPESKYFERHRLGPEAKAIGPPEDIKHVFRGTDQEVEAYAHKINVRGKVVTVIEPKTRPEIPGKEHETLDNVIYALSILSIQQANALDRVEINPREYKQDPDTVATGDYTSKSITFYPKSPDSASTTDSNLLHELGHVVMPREDAFRKTWEAARKADAKDPSQYAMTNYKEDFSEFYVAYSIAKGTKCEEEIKLLYPHRYKALREIDPSPESSF